YPRSTPLEVREARFPHEPVRDDSPGYANLHLFGFQIRRRSLHESLHQLRRRVCPPELVRKRGVTPRHNLFQLLLPLLKLVLWFKLQDERSFLVAWHASIATPGMDEQLMCARRSSIPPDLHRAGLTTCCANHN